MDNPGITSDSLKQYKSTQVSFYEKLTDKTNAPMQISDIFRSITRAPGYRHIIDQIRRETNKTAIDKLKKKLPAVTPSGYFDGPRKIQNLIRYTGVICLDFDDVVDLVDTKNKLKEDPYTYAVFLSPSGKRLKSFVKVFPDKDEHSDNFHLLESYNSKKYNLTVDKSCKDITRLMFLTFDEGLFVNYDSKVWTLEEHENFYFEYLLDGFKVKESFVEGNRNNFIYKFASLCCRRKIEKGFCQTKLFEKFSGEDFTKDEILRTVKSAFNSPGNIDDTEIDKESPRSYSLLARVEKYLNDKYEIRFNEVSIKVEYREKDSGSAFKELNENSLFRELQHNNLPLSINRLTSLMQSDFVPAYNPFLDYFESLKPWNSSEDPDYISLLTKYLPVNDQERFEKQFKKMLVRCIACALDVKVFNKQVFVLVHDMQNSGKSTFCRWLCPPALSHYIAENINTDKDSIIALATNFLINMDELATLSRPEISSLKSFISKDKINIRLPFGKRAVTMPRRANFVGSTNKDEFLTDETGSVRWQCFKLTGMINFKYKDEIDINDIWRQAYSLYKQGFNYQLTPQEIEENEAANKEFQVNSCEMELIPKHYSPSSKENGSFVTATDILNKLSLIYPHLKFNLISIGKALKLTGFKKEQDYIRERKQSIKGYFVREF